MTPFGPKLREGIGLYQSVDTPDANVPAQRGRKRPLWLGLIIAAAFIIFAIIYAKNTAPEPEISESTTTQEAHEAYLKAISEPNAALRRARLQDFLKVHPTDTRKIAATAQLDVLSAYETRDWNYITKIAYEDGLSHEERLTVLDSYNERWGGDLLGGRAEDIEELRARILDLPDRTPVPDRRLEEQKSPIPQDIKSDKLLGEPRRIFRRRVVPPPPPPVTRPPKRIEPKPEDKVVAPTIRRHVKPRYPTKAIRNNVEGLVVLRLSIDAKGRVRLTELVEVQAPRYQKEFIKSARRAARKTRFHPQTVNGKPVPVTGIIKRYKFQSGK